MITAANIKSLSITRAAIKVFNDAGGELVTKQDKILNSVYVKRSGNLSALLRSNPFHVETNGTEVKLVVKYLAQIRFMDLKHTSAGKTKKRYKPIYNKYVWGFMVGYTYNNLRAGLANSIQNSLSKAELNIII